MNNGTNLCFKTMEEFITFVRSFLREEINLLSQNQQILKIPEAGFLYKPLINGHFHYNIEVFYQISGMTRFTFHHGRFDLYPGEICIMPRGCAHGEKHCDYRGPFYHLLFGVQIDTLTFHITRAESIFCCETFSYPDTGKLEVYLNDIITYYRENDSFSGELAYDLLRTFLKLQCHILSHYKDIKTVENPKVSQCLKLIHGLLNYPGLSVKYLSECLDMSGDYLSFIFKKTTGVNLIDYIHGERMKLAKYILRDATLNINEVAWSCGYNDPGYFARVFKKMFQQSPMEYRKVVCESLESATGEGGT